MHDMTTAAEATWQIWALIALLTVIALALLRASQPCRHNRGTTTAPDGYERCNRCGIPVLTEMPQARWIGEYEK